MFGDLRRRKLACLFAAFDGDKDGVLTDADPAFILANLARLADLEPGAPQREALEQGFLAYWRDFVMTSDLDRDGRVTLDEWYAYHAEMLADEVRFEMTAAMSASVMFALVDGDQDGVITLEEYGAWLSAWNVDRAAIDGAFLRHLDVGGDGHLTHGQVLALTREFFYSDDPDAPGNWAMGPY